MKELIIEETEGSQTRLMITGDEFTIVQTSIGYDGVREYHPPVVLTRRAALNLHRAISEEIFAVKREW
jgi:hypothetical protein